MAIAIEATTAGGYTQERLASPASPQRKESLARAEVVVDLIVSLIRTDKRIQEIIRNIITKYQTPGGDGQDD